CTSGTAPCPSACRRPAPEPERQPTLQRTAHRSRDHDTRETTETDETTFARDGGSRLSCLRVSRGAALVSSYRGCVTTSSSAGSPFVTRSSARVIAGASAFGSLIGPSPYRPYACAIFA